MRDRNHHRDGRERDDPGRENRSQGLAFENAVLFGEHGGDDRRGKRREQDRLLRERASDPERENRGEHAEGVHEILDEGVDCNCGGQSDLFLGDDEPGDEERKSRT